MLEQNCTSGTKHQADTDMLFCVCTRALVIAGSAAARMYVGDGR